MNRRHKAVLALSLAIAGFALLNGAKLSEGLGIILIGASVAWLVGSQFVLAGAKIVWRRRILFASITVVGIAGVYGWIKYDAYQTEKQQAAYQAKMKPQLDCENRNAQFVNAATECEKNSNVTLEPVPQPTSLPTPLPSDSPSLPSRLPSRHVRALNDTDLNTTELGSLKCGHMRAGEIAVLLVDDNTWVKIRTGDGQVGWAFSSDFEVVGK